MKVKSRQPKCHSLALNEPLDVSFEWCSSNVLTEKNRNTTQCFTSTYHPLSKKNMIVTKAMASKFQKLPLNNRRIDENTVSVSQFFEEGKQNHCKH
jgi:hypothetical protein